MLEAKALPNGVTCEVDGTTQRVHRLLCVARPVRRQFRPDPRIAVRAGGRRRSVVAAASQAGKKRSRRAVVAEGAGQHLFSLAHQGADPSGNAKLGHRTLPEAADHHLLQRMRHGAESEVHSTPELQHSAACQPILMTRQRICSAHNAVHAAMSGRTEMVVGWWNGRFRPRPDLALAIANAIRSIRTATCGCQFWNDRPAADYSQSCGHDAPTSRREWFPPERDGN